jgi:predicted phage terminase large subunit-like protein
MNLRLTRNEREWFERQLARESLIHFCRHVDPVAAERYGARHLMAIAEKLEAVERGEVKRLFITCPPRHWKSSLVTEKFPLWLLSLHPEWSIGLFSHGERLPAKFSRNIRANIEGNQRYQSLFPTVKIGKSTETDWSLTTAYRSSLRAFGVGSSPTGEGFDCLTGETLITTESGEIPIKDFQRELFARRVLAYDERQRRLVFKRIKAIANRAESWIYRITSAGGRVVEASGNHPFYVLGKGYIPADSVAVGDNLLCAMPSVPYNLPCQGAFQAEGDSVALVERIRRETRVWNLQVEGTQNFFANGILTHNCIIIDDPIADAQEAYSPSVLEKVWVWYQETLRDRLNPGGFIVMVMSRWHENDPAGHVTRASKDGTGEHWEEFRLPALAENGDLLGRNDGEALWPELWPVEELAKVRLAQGERAFAARYQGSPRAMQGNLLDSTKLVMVDAGNVPKLTRIVRRWDLAFSDTRAADFSAGVKMGMSEDGKRWILHVRQVKGRWPQTEPAIRATAAQDGTGCEVLIESNGTQLGYADSLIADPRMRGYIVRGDKPEGSKETRASLWGARLEDGIIGCVRGEWNGMLFDQMDTFPNGSHDDIIDGISGGWANLGDTRGAWTAGALRSALRSSGCEESLAVN